MLRYRQLSIPFRVTASSMFTASQYIPPLQPPRQLPTVCSGQSEPKDPMVKLFCFLDLQTPEEAVKDPHRQSLCI